MKKVDLLSSTFVAMININFIYESDLKKNADVTNYFNFLP